MKTRLVLLVVLGVLGFSSCRTALTRWLGDRGFLAVGVPSTEWEPGTVVLWRNGSDGLVYADTVCRRKQMHLCAPVCARAADVSETKVSEWAAELSAGFLKAAKASARTGSIRSARLTLSNVEECSIPISQLKERLLATECGEAARSALVSYLQKPDGFVTWVNKAIRADVRLEIETSGGVDAGVVLTLDDVKALLKTANIPISLEGGLKFSEGEKAVLAGDDLYLGFRGGNFTDEQLRAIAGSPVERSAATLSCGAGESKMFSRCSLDCGPGIKDERRERLVVGSEFASSADCGPIRTAGGVRVGCDELVSSDDLVRRRLRFSATAAVQCGTHCAGSNSAVGLVWTVPVSVARISSMDEYVLEASVEGDLGECTVSVDGQVLSGSRLRASVGVTKPQEMMVKVECPYDPGLSKGIAALGCYGAQPGAGPSPVSREFSLDLSLRRSIAGGCVETKL